MADFLHALSLQFADLFQFGHIFLVQNLKNTNINIQATHVSWLGSHLKRFVLAEQVVPVLQTRVYVAQFHAERAAEIGIREKSGLLVAAAMTGQKFRGPQRQRSHFCPGGRRTLVSTRGHAPFGRARRRVDSRSAFRWFVVPTFSSEPSAR